jgi:hypothetical protein
MAVGRATSVIERQLGDPAMSAKAPTTERLRTRCNDYDIPWRPVAMATLACLAQYDAIYKLCYVNGIDG